MRSRSGWLIGLVFTVVVLLCVSGGLGAYFVVSRVEGRGAKTPTSAVDTLIQGIFTDRDKDAATRYICAQISPDVVEQKIDDVNELLRNQPGATYTWDVSEKRRSRTEAVYTVRLDLRKAEQTINSQEYEVGAESDGGWRVCSFKRVRS